MKSLSLSIDTSSDSNEIMIKSSMHFDQHAKLALKVCFKLAQFKALRVVEVTHDCKFAYIIHVEMIETTMSLHSNDERLD